MPKNQSVTVNGVSFDIEHNKAKSEADFVKHEKHHFDGDEVKTKETFKLFKEAIAPAKAEDKK